MESTSNISNNSQADKKYHVKRPNGNPAAIESENKMSPFLIRSRSPSPDKNKLLSPKPNQVSNVILYGIPIVSLFIENQERLCLAQISNTLLKQFSYNEIHNRRVALGITCVQCTPVQLEILRRAGAMPVSSRRCGMITRREAERLCKSFLGDNSPPRLPDDFSFAVFHECAWGCRGAFLPSRYNSSRAKCIKCTYCGLFFSPNKFIFHSHRLSPNDKYIQPDAANFNSWRRHLRLTGSPSENVIHAWEDVKAMFNGGTRKRLMSSPIVHERSTPNSKLDVSSSKRSKDTHSNSSNAQFSIKSIHGHTAENNSANNQTPVSVNANTTTSSSNATVSTMRGSSFTQELPFSLSRSFMIDYMWHQQQQQAQIPTQTASMGTNKSNFQFPPYSALNWIKQQPSSFLFKPNGTSITPLNASSNDGKPSAFNHFHSAAFKPVINMRLNDETNALNTVSLPTTTNLPIHSQSPAANYNHPAMVSDEEPLIPAKRFIERKNSLKGRERNFCINVDENSCEEKKKICGADGECYDAEMRDVPGTSEEDENEMVDIETTEDDVQIYNLKPYRPVDLPTHDSSSAEEEECEIEVADEKMLEKNNNLTAGEEKKHVKSSHKYQKFEYEAEDKLNSPPHNRDWTLNLKKDNYNKFDSSTFSYVHKIHSDKTPLEGSLTTTPTKLWSIARLSLECNNNGFEDDSMRTSFYQQLSQIQQKSSHNIDNSI